MAVVGRGGELAAVSAFLEPGADRPPVLVVEGEAGLGKTTLCRFASAEAAERGYRVLGCGPVEAEFELSFAALRDLVTAVFDDLDGALPEPQRHALSVVLLREAPRGPPPDRGAVAVS